MGATDTGCILVDAQALTRKEDREMTQYWKAPEFKNN